MAIKINGTTVIDTARAASLERAGIGSTASLPASGNAVGDTIFFTGAQKLAIWNGSDWVSDMGRLVD